MFKFLIVILVYYAEYTNSIVQHNFASPGHKHISHLLESLSCEIHRVMVIQ